MPYKIKQNKTIYKKLFLKNCLLNYYFDTILKFYWIFLEGFKYVIIDMPTCICEIMFHVMTQSQLFSTPLYIL